jgi:hypothetical protein
MWGRWGEAEVEVECVEIKPKKIYYHKQLQKIFYCAVQKNSIDYVPPSFNSKEPAC